jgi:hypothetical protein
MPGEIERIFGIIIGWAVLGGSYLINARPR